MLWLGGSACCALTMVGKGEMAGQLEGRWFGTARVQLPARTLGRITFPEVPGAVVAPPEVIAPTEMPSDTPLVPRVERLLLAPTASPASPRWQPWLIGLLLYLGAALPLIFNLDWHPPVYFNWEEYSAWGIFNFLDAPTLAHFAPTDGLMTDSGRLPLVVGPVLLGWRIWGTGSLIGMRLPIALLAALTVPLCWRFGRRLVGDGPALLGAVLLALSPVFLLYGRTATVVGLSLLPALATAWLLLRVLDNPTPARIVLLQVALIADGFAYAPIRFLWPIALAALVLEMLLRPALRRSLAVALLVTTVILPTWLWGTAAWVAHTRHETERPAIKLVLKRYYNGRGEQLLASGDHLPPLGAIAAYVGHNAEDSLQLLLDRDTESVITAFWNPHGRLQPRILVLPALLGFACVGWRARRSHEARLLLLLFAGFWLPLLLTSQVHVGRLIYVVPLLALLTAEGATFLASGLIALIARSASIRHGTQRAVTGARRGTGLRWALAVLLVVVVASNTWTDYQVDPLVEHLARDVLQIQAYSPKLAAAQRAAVLALIPEDPEGEAIVASGYRLRLEESFRFVDLARPVVRAPYDPADPRPPLLYGGDPIAALGQERACAALYFTPTDRAAEITARLEAFHCATLPTLVILPR